MGITGTNAIVGIQLGYSVSDIISKCGVGLVRAMIVHTYSLRRYVSIWCQEILTKLHLNIVLVLCCCTLLSNLCFFSRTTDDLPNLHCQVVCDQGRKRRNSFVRLNMNSTVRPAIILVGTGVCHIVFNWILYILVSVLFCFLSFQTLLVQWTHTRTISRLIQMKFQHYGWAEINHSIIWNWRRDFVSFRHFQIVLHIQGYSRMKYDRGALYFRKNKRTMWPGGHTCQGGTGRTGPPKSVVL